MKPKVPVEPPWLVLGQRRRRGADAEGRSTRRRRLGVLLLLLPALQGLQEPKAQLGRPAHSRPIKMQKVSKMEKNAKFFKLHCKSRHAPGTADGEICMAGKMMAGSIAVFEYNLVNSANVIHDATMLQGRRFRQTRVEGKHCTNTMPSNPFHTLNN